jgi:16S rRNA (cytosine1402-N4)-methyltransferase
MYHQPVLLNESIEGLQIKPGGIYVDVTYGGGGHSKAILDQLENGRLLAFDQDQDALANLSDDNRLTLINHNFRYLKQFLKYYDALPVDGILADLGVSSHQFDRRERGFSFRMGGELDLRMNRKQKITAQTIINSYTQEELTYIFKNYGELPNAHAIAAAIAGRRTHGSIKTFELLQHTIGHFTTKHKENKFFAKVMQALRIEVNQELEALKEMLLQTAGVLKNGGRLVVISYHSLEDRLVKNFIKTGNFKGTVEKDFFGNPKRIFKNLTSKPVIPSQQETEENPRARSAKLRIAEKINQDE